MAKDLLVALSRVQTVEGNEESDGNGTLTLKMEDEGNSDDDIEKFLTQVNTIWTLIEEFSQSVEQLKKLHSDYLGSPLLDDYIMRAKVDNFVTSTNETAILIKAKLEAMKHEFELNECKNRSSAFARIRQSQISSIWRNFTEVIIQYNNAQLEYRDELKRSIRLWMAVSGRHIENDELEELIESGDMTAVFTRGIIMDYQAAKQSLTAMEDRHNDVLRLERGLKDLNWDYNMCEIALLQDQGDVIDRVEHNVHLTVDHIQNAKSY